MNNNFCVICGSENVTDHHSDPHDRSDKKVIYFCRKHHDDIENIKMAIRIMKREKKVMSVRQFRKIIDSIEDNGVLKNG